MGGLPSIRSRFRVGWAFIQCPHPSFRHLCLCGSNLLLWLVVYLLRRLPQPLDQCCQFLLVTWFRGLGDGPCGPVIQSVPYMAPP